MYAQVEKLKETKGKAVVNSVAQNKSIGKQGFGFGFVDNRHKNVKQLMLRRSVSSKAQKLPVATAIIPWVNLSPKLLIGEGQDRVTRAAVLSGLKDTNNFYFHIKAYWKTIRDLEGNGWSNSIYANKMWVEHMSKYGVGLVDMGSDGREYFSRFYQAELDGARDVGASLTPADEEVAAIATKETERPKTYPTPKKVDDGYQDMVKEGSSRQSL